MKLTNNALQELYDTLVNCAFSFSPYTEGPIDKVFIECDDKLQKDIDIWKRSNDILLSANLEAIGKKRKLEKDLDDAVKENEKLKASLSYSALQKMQKDLDDAKNQLNYCTHSRDNWRGRAKYAEDELRGANKQIQTLKDFNSEITSKNVDIASRNVELARKNELLEAKVLETTETLEKANADRTELQKDRDSYHGLYTELRKDYDKLFEDNRKLKTRTDCLRVEVEYYRKHYKEQSDKIKELKSRLNGIIYVRNGVGKNYYDQGQTDLWVKLQNVNNSQPFELATCFPDVTGMEDILSWDLEDFLDAYKKWWEEKENERFDHMRDYLDRFCEGRLCSGCPLESNEYKCGCGYSFKKAADWDMKIIPDEELERYYNKAWHGDADCMKETRKRVKEACDAFAEGLKAGLASEVKEVPVSCDIPIKDLASWECTLEATVEVNKDLLEKVCGVKPEEEEHKLEYGDAVRVSWSNFDYMYIGPDEHRIRLFDPKYRCVIFVSSTEKLTYQGSKIIICDEEDLRKIWKDKK